MKKKKILLYSLILLVAIVLVVLVFNIVPSGENSNFNILRIDGISKEMMTKGISGAPYWIYTSQLSGYGYASPLFYGDLFLYIPAFLVYLGMKIQLSYVLFILMVIILSGLTMYLCTKKIFNKLTVSVVSSTVYMILVFLLIEFLSKKIFSEFSFMIFLPLVINGVYSILYKDKNKIDIIKVSLGLAGIAFSQIIIAVIITVVIVFVSLANIRRFVYIIIALIFMIGVSSYYTFPLIEQLSQSNITVKDIIPTEIKEESFIQKRGEIISSNYEKLKTSLKRNRYTLDFNFRKNKENNTYVELPLIMYKGYAAIDKNTDRQYEVVTSESGLVQVNINDIYQGDLRVFYRGTEIQNYTVVLSTISIIALFGFVFYKKEGKKC